METLTMYGTKTKRTNSLAFAQVDCHTCALSGDQCDRRRPKCSTCLSQGRKCGGFATPLSWNPKRMLSFHPFPGDTQLSGDVSSREDRGVSDSSVGCSSPVRRSSTIDAPLRFRFVDNPSRAKKRRRTHSTGVGNTDPSPLRVSQEIFEETEDIPPVSEGEIESINHVVGDPNETNNLDLSDRSILEEFDLCNTTNPSIFGLPPWFDLGVQEHLFSDPPGIFSFPRSPISTMNEVNELSEQQFSFNLATQEISSIVPSVMQQRHRNDGVETLPEPTDVPTTTIFGLSSKDYDWLFEMYDSKLCVLPITSDTTINPFRCKPQTWHGSRLLFHAVLALCYRHLNLMTSNWSDEVVEHRGRAVQLLATELGNIESQAQNCLHLLGPILILFTLDCTLSATGHWSGHLERAHMILQACGGPECLISPQQRSQVGMLLWWDATIALVSRRCPTIDRSYLDYILKWEAQDEWSFFDLTGCPRDLFVHLYQLTDLARQSRIACSLEWVSFNLTPVIEVENKLKGWKNELDPSLIPLEPLANGPSERDLHEQYDRYHCAEAWRCALLLYIEDVFKSDRRHSPTQTQLVRRTLDHIRCCRRSSQTQKQLLLPIFLAGSGTSDEDMRGFVKDYCAYWAEKSRYSMFNSVPALFDEIWTSGEWWGAVINGKSSGSTTGPRGKLTTQLLLG